MKHLHKKLSLKKIFTKGVLLSLLTILSPVIILGAAFFVTKEITPHASELAFTEYSSLGKSAGSVIPASCESGEDHGATVGCWNGTTISACSSCPEEPAKCVGYSNSYSVGCPPYYSGDSIQTDNYTCAGTYGSPSLTSSSVANSCTCPNTTTTQSGGACPYMYEGYTEVDVTRNCTGAEVSRSAVRNYCYPVYVELVSFTNAPTSAPDVDSGESAYLSWSVLRASSCSLSGGQYSNTNVGAASGGITTSALSSNTTYTLTCQGQFGPVSANTTVYVASGSISSSASSCIIALNQSTCPVTLSWNSVNMTNPNITSQTGAAISYSPSGSQSWNVNYGQQTYTFRNHSYVHSSVTVIGYCTGGTLWNGTVCESALKIGNISYTPSTPADVDYGEGAILNWTGVENATSCALSGGQFTNANVGTAMNGSTTTVPLYANTTYTLTCQGFGESVSKQVVVPVASGSIDATPTVCIIPNGQSSCITDVTWTTFNMSAPRVTNASDVTMSISPTGNGVQFPAYYGNNTFALKNGLFTHDSVVVNAACDPSAIWNGVMCVATNGAPSINSASCFIAAGASTCEVNVSWSVTNPTGAVTVTRPYAGDSVFASGNSGTQPATFPYGTYSLDLRDSGTALTSGTFSAICVNGSSWNGSVCAPLSSSVTGTMNSSSCVILAGNSSCQLNVVWSTVNATPPVTITRPYDSDSQFATGASGNQPATFIGEGTWNLNLRSAGNILASGTYTTACEIGAVWNGSVCSLTLVTGNLVVSANECLISTGQNTCNVNATWVTFGASSPSLRNDTIGGAALSTLATRVIPFPITVSYPSNLFALKEGSVNLDTETVTARCAVGGWDTVTSRCANPSVTSVVVTGQYYEPSGTIAVTCSNANRYRVVHSETGTVIANNLVYPGFTVNVPVTLTGNYAIYCLQGSYASAPEVRYYNAGPPPSSAIVLSASPRTIPRSSNTAITWTIQHPRSSCILEAKTICSSGVCSEDQVRETTALNNRILNEFTDSQSIQDLVSPRTILSSLRTIPSSRADTDWKTTGRKTFNLKYSTEFVLSCGASVSQSARVLITTTGER